MQTTSTIFRFIGKFPQVALQRWISSVLWISCLHAEEIPNNLFDIPIKSGESIHAEALQDIIPVSIFALHSKMTHRDVRDKLPDFRFERSNTPSGSTWLIGTTPESAYFECFDARWTAGHLVSVRLSARRLPPTAGRYLRTVTEFRRLLGEPDGAYRQIEYGRANPLSLTLEWKRSDHILRLSSLREGQIFEWVLDYYPGPTNPVVPRINTSAREAVAFETVEVLTRDYLAKLSFLPEGDGPAPPIILPEGESAMLSAYAPLNLRKAANNRDWVEYWQPFRQRLEKALDAHYSGLEDPDRFERLTKIAEHKLPGFSSGEAQVGAAAYLASHGRLEVIDFLLRGMDVELPSGVSTECAAGIAQMCKGKVMDRILDMLASPNERDNATSILLALSTRSQFRELKGKAHQRTREANERLDTVISIIESRQLDD